MVAGRFTLSPAPPASAGTPVVTLNSSNVILTFSGPLAANTTYQVTVNALTSPLRRADNADVALSAPFVRGFLTVVMAPTLAIDEDPDANTITLTFSRRVAAATVVASRFQVARAVTPGGTETFETINSVDTGSNPVIVLRLADLRHSTAYTLRILPGITDETTPNPVPLFPITQPNLEIGFTTDALPSFTYDRASALGLVLTLHFSREVRGSTVNNNSVTLQNLSTMTFVGRDPNVDTAASGSTITFAFGTGLPPNTRFRATVAATVLDVDGQALASDGLSREFDSHRTFVLAAGSVPVYDATARTLSFTFERAVDRDTISGTEGNAKFTVSTTAASGSTAVIDRVVPGTDGASVTLRFTAALIGGVSYTLAIDRSVTDTSGNRYTGTSRNFDTGGAFTVTDAPELRSSNTGLDVEFSLVPNQRRLQRPTLGGRLPDHRVGQ